ncbi:MAG: excinuclease ABC subunit UvrC [Desulfovibrio sp.]
MDFEFTPADYTTMPGVYLMKDSGGHIIYVGKARNLRKRLSSYFQSKKGHTRKTLALVAKIRRIDTLMTSTEKEALLLEASLIKKHRPRYNVVLRDDKQYLLFRLTKRAEYPRLMIARKVVRDGSVYFGPFTSSSAARATWKLINKVFLLRKCSDSAFANRTRPCLYYDMKQCLGPCCHEVDRKEYFRFVKQVEYLLMGRADDLLKELRQKMEGASAELAFEKAALYRDQIRAVERTVEGQGVVLADEKDRDIIELADTDKGLGLGLLFVRKGRLIDQKSFFWHGLTYEESPEVLHSFLNQFYSASRFIPSRLVLPFEIDPLIVELLAERREGNVQVTKAFGPQEQKLKDIARKLALSTALRKKDDDLSQVLQQAFRLNHPVRRIECIDGSHLGGEGMRVGMVVFEDGMRVPEDSRAYSFPELEGTGDDYAALSGWVHRRIKSGAPWPDLILIDGGKGQIAAVEKAVEDALAEAGIDLNLELASIAKGPSRRAGELEDRIFRPNRSNPINFKAGSPPLLFLQRVRDEAHRFVIGSQRKSRKKKTLHSEIMNIDGVGPSTARLLWDQFGSVQKMFDAKEKGISQIKGIGKAKASIIFEGLRQMKKLREGK